MGLNLIYLTPGESGGMETYARELIPHLATQPGLTLTAFVNRAAASAGGPWAEYAEQITVDVDVANRIQWVRAEQQLLPGLCRRAGVDLLHSLGSTAPLWGATPRVTTVHDLLYAKVPEAHFGLRALGMRALVPAAARRSRRVIVDAASTRDDLEADLGIDPAKVDVVPLAAADTGAEPAGEPVLRERFGLGDRPVVLSVSAKRPHKNLAALVRAVAALPAGQRPVLVIPGYRTPHEAELAELAAGLGVAEDLRMPGWIDAAELEGLYAMARACVLPSRYEGFGLPVLEAMRRGVPVACSDRSSLPEVAGGAALLFDPDDQGAVQGALGQLMADAALRERLSAAGRERAALFSWQASAEATAESYGRALA